MARFPTAEALAEAPAADVIGAWSGLGYNRRALSLQAAARVVAEHGWPERLEALPGVGRYTAAAVGSFAWDRQEAAVDTNVRRVIERRDGVRRSPRALARRAAELLPEGRAAAWNQAMMELGATVCRPRRPRCGECPLQEGCAGPDTVAPLPRPRGVRFEATDRWARGRILAALVEGGEQPEMTAERRERALAGLARDGLIVLGEDGTARLP
jgi:A/G-specific adenine glycosylase